ncbi:hypothetical protein [Aquimarina aquimarini]|uniref:hypothetical protein n=1 Tax=Aquimarina aquimarini TaxID=1191734 RepID=UPI000D559C63|nr:hypothetical protein [Aquimarina aquimarini]
MKKIVFVLVVFSICIACGTHKERKEFRVQFNEYLISKGLDPKKVDGMEYIEEYMEVEEERKKEKLLNHPYLKTNQVYISKDQEDDYYVFKVYDDEGHAYIGSSNIVGENLSFPKDGVITVTDPIILDFLGFYKLESNKLTIKRWRNTAYRKWYENDIGFVRKDSLYITGWYYAKEIGFKRKWLAITHKSDFKARYAPNLKARRKPGRNNTKFFLIEEGSFKVK